MADINQIITLGIGTPASVEHFVLVGLNANPSVGGRIMCSIAGPGGLAAKGGIAGPGGGVAG